MSIEIPEDMITNYGQGWQAEDLQQDGFSKPGDRRRAGLSQALNGLTPDAKRDLAAQLLRSANEAEGHPEGAPNEDATSVAFRCDCTGLSHDRSCPAWVLPV
jgi:hypothetical protein